MSSQDSEVKAPVLRWLHLTDLHVGRKNEAQETALRNLIESVRNQCGSAEYDLVLLTGDLAYSGQDEEYRRLEQLVIEPLRDLENFQNAIFIATPGNHDLDCDIGLPVIWEKLGADRQGKFFNLDEAGVKTRSSRAGAFKSYSDFLRRAAVRGVDPTMEPAKVDRLTIRGVDVAVISCVTAYFSDRDVADFQLSPAPVHPLRTLLQQLGEGLPIIVLGHHPLSWFAVDTEKRLRTLLMERNAIYINGHEHEITSKFGGRGLLSIGFGAVYQAALDAPAKPYYRNSFAICELEDSLHVKVVSWDGVHGTWHVDNALPPEFDEPSASLDGGVRLPLASTKISSINRPFASLAASIKANVELDRCIWLVSDGPKRWVQLLTETGRLQDVVDTFNLRSQQLAAGHHEFRVKDRRGNHLAYVVSGSGDVLTYDHLQSINTELDTQDYTGCIVATLGKLSDEAETLANKLKTRKSILVLEREALVRDLIRHGPAEIRKVISAQNPSVVKLSMVVTDDGTALLRQERTSTAWFNIIDNKGRVLDESDPTVVRLREDLPEFKSVRYQYLEESGQSTSAGDPYQSLNFNLQQYLEANYAYFDDVRYAPLAALGFRFRTTSLSEIYVNATADVNGNSKNTQSINRAVDEFIESLNLPKAQKDQLESQLRSRLGVDPSSEVGAARQLYQRYNNVVVLGDPGSGKTCFVKYEILAYCRPPNDGGSWYANHIPIYVSLAEASRLSNANTDLLTICEILSARRGIPLPKPEILKALSDGRAAIFFDGLDEVGFLEKRIRLMAEINELFKNQAKRGNRFVLSSRPAAVQPVEMPEGLTYLHLKGLSEQEMRVLAGRVLTARVGEGEGNITTEEAAVVERLIEDTKHSPGIARIARNPLLLTLLVLIYANTGAVSAKRHLIYTQAIKTLVSVRGRETKEQQMSEADLRTRLGALAVAIFSREIAEIPRRSEVLKILSPLMGAGVKGDEVSNAFLQEVAEATGLLSIHTEDSSETLDLITFMHYSFLEYYAAAGLLSRDYLSKLPEIAGNPRWKDVVTLLFGILSEQSDVTPALQALMALKGPTQEVTKSRLLLAMDCAAECDVPPLATQDLLANAIAETVGSGVGRVSAKVREALAEKMGFFLQVAGARFDAVLIAGLRSNDALTSAAYADLLARLPQDVTLQTGVVEAFGALLSRKDAVVTAACMYAVERRDELRIEFARSAIVRALKGSLVEKHAALEVLVAVPAYYEECSNFVEELLDDTNDFIASTAAQCVLVNSKALGATSESTATTEKLLTKLSLVSDEGGLSLPGITLDRQHLGLMVASDSKAASELALRYISLVRDDPQFIYQTLVQTLKVSDDPRHKAACLDSLRVSPRAIDLITIADTDLICNLLQASERNVRVAAVRLLGEMPDDEQVIRSLQEYLQALKNTKFRDSEILEVAKALSKHTKRSHSLREQLLQMVSAHLPGKAGFGDGTEQKHLVALLTICESLDANSDNVLANRLLVMAEDYKTPENIRKHAIRAYGRVCEPSSVSVDHLIRLLGRHDPKLAESLYAACLSLLNQCRRKVEHVRRVYGRLGSLRDQLHTCWQREITLKTESIDLSGARDIRDAIVGIEDLVAQYGEFSERAQVGSK